MSHERELVPPDNRELPLVERDRRIKEFLKRGVDSVYPSEDSLRLALESGNRLTAYMGIDPTSTELHLGHVSQLYKLKRLQEMGHHVILLIGDFTAMIGDPTDKSAARVKLTHDQVLKNANTYKEQAAKILDFDHPTNPIELRYNSEWLGQMSFGDVVELASEITVQQMSERDMFQKRFKGNQPVYLHEFLYPLMQGWDSVALDVDIEIGGSDQIFNMLVGRDLIKKHKGKEKFVVGGSLLVDPSGKKIGKTEGNMVTVLDKPEQMYHKIMMWGDQIVPHALELCSELPMEEIEKIKAELRQGTTNPIESKKFLARTIVASLNSSEAANFAELEYNKASQEQQPESIREFRAGSGKSIVDILVESGLAKSKGDARRLIQQKGVRLSGETVIDSAAVLNSGEHTLQVGKKTTDSFRKIIVD